MKEKKYSIGFKGLNDGLHCFSYVLEDDYFASVENTLYNKGRIELTIELKKSEQMLALDFQANGTIASICDNCLEAVDVQVDFQANLMIEFGDNYDEPSEDVIILPHEEQEFNFAKYVYDLIVTSLPIRHIHEADEDGNVACNSEMLGYLSEYLVQEQITDEESDSDIDPRWNDLKKLLDKN